MRHHRWFLATVVLLTLARTAGAAQSYIYVAVASPPCTPPSPCAPGQLLVFDAITRQLVTHTQLGSATNLPRGMAISQDGRRLYISMGPDANGDTSLAVFDTSRHVMGPTFRLAPVAAGPVGVTRDGSRVFIAGSSRLVVWDAATTSVRSSQDVSYTNVFGHPVLDRVLAGTIAPVWPSLKLFALDEMTGLVVASKDHGFSSRLSISPDGSRIYDTLEANPAHPSNGGGHVNFYDPATLEQTGSLGLAPLRFPALTLDAPGRKRVYVLGGGFTVDGAPWSGIDAFDRATGQAVGSLSIGVTRTGAVVSADERRLGFVTQATPSGGTDALTLVNLDTFTLDGTIPLSTNPLLLAATPAAAARCSYAVNTHQSSWTRDGGVATITLTSGCAWLASTSAGWLHLPADAGSGVGIRSIDVTVDPYVPPQSGQDATRTAALTIGGQVVTFTQAGFSSQAAFGFVDTPGDNAAGITGSLPVTGWALDDVDVARVRIFRDAVSGEPTGQVYIGDATFVDGARPDVEAAFPSVPFASGAGWGYLLLTNVLPGGGTGTYRLHAYADDIDGHTTLLGSRTVTCTNNTATLPFGAIDTPGQGETVFGTITNWGWALTPAPAAIPQNGSSIDVVIDGTVVGHPVYNVNRTDVASLFPGYVNTNGAGGYFTIDTTTLANGLHTIAWLVRDNAGHATGVGSRYFTVGNP